MWSWFRAIFVFRCDLRLRLLCSRLTILPYWNGPQAGRYLTNCSIKPNPLDLTRKGKFWGQKSGVRRPIHSEIPVFSYEWQSLNSAGVLNLDCTDEGVWWHCECVTLTGKFPKRIQLDVSVWTAITQCQRNTIKCRFFCIGYTCLYFDYAVLEGEILAEIF